MIDLGARIRQSRQQVQSISQDQELTPGSLCYRILDAQIAYTVSSAAFYAMETLFCGPTPKVIQVYFLHRRNPTQ
jgi:hypothetical protein